MFFKQWFGGGAGDYKKYVARVRAINALEESLKKLTDEELREKTSKFKKRFKDGESLDAMAEEAFACVREAARRTLGQRHYDVQLWALLFCMMEISRK